MLHVVMTTIEEELEFRKADAKPSHASLLDISNIGLEDDDDDSDDLEGASPAGGPFTPGRFTRGVSLPPTPAAETPPRNPWDSGRAVSVSRDTSPSGKRRFTRWAFSVTVSVDNDKLYSQAKIKLWGDMQTRKRVAQQRSLLLHQAQVSNSIHRIDYLQGMKREKELLCHITPLPR